MTKKPWIIAGPCALESKEQLQKCVHILKQLEINTMRASLWKPRTRPGWDGMGGVSLSMLLEETIPHQMTPATEVLSAEHALAAIHAVETYGSDAKMLVWIGSRNQNHLEQRKIAKILATGPEGMMLMFKNQPWEDENHWLGICEHILAEGFPRERLIICHRGFAPGKMDNPRKLRNIPDFEMAMRVKKAIGLAMILDPSHIGGSQANVIEICRQSLEWPFDGYLIEMHEDPCQARTDANQQLSPEQLTHVLNMLRLTPSEEMVLEGSCL